MAKPLRKHLWEDKKHKEYVGNRDSFGKSIDNVFIVQSVSRQVCSLYHTEFFTKCVLALPLSIYSSHFSLISSGSSLHLLLRLPVAFILPSIFPSLTCFRGEFKLLTYLLTPWSRVLLENLTGFAASQEIPRIYGTRKFITVLTSARHPSLS
jgi:hypothetical protein